MKKRQSENRPEHLIMALGDPVKQAKLRTICYRLKELDRKCKAHDYISDKDVSWLEYVSYGIGGVKFSKIADFFNI